MSIAPAATSAATATTQTSATTQSSATSATGTQSLGENQFLQLLMTELKNQDPMSPSSSDPTQFMTQLAQFTSLEQQTNTAQSTAQMASQQSQSSAVALIGHNVTYTDPTTGATGTGTVQSVEMTSSGATLTINGTAGIVPSSVTEVS
jgi:flagellar basal-body rod modification protein FlgD